MGKNTFAALFCAATVLAGPAFARGELALVAPRDSSAPEVQLDAVVLSTAAQAIEAELARQTAPKDKLEAALLDEIRVFYAAREFEPLWIRGSRGSSQMAGLRMRMDAAESEGLDPGIYVTPAFALTYPDDPSVLAAADVEFSRTAVRFITHLSSGRLDPASVSQIITQQPERPAAAAILAKMSRTAGVAAALARYEPPHAEFAALKRKLGELRAATASDRRVVIPDGPALRRGATDARVPLLRQRLALTLAPDAEPEIFDAALVDALRAFQTAGGLGADGILGPRTIAALNGMSQVDQIAAVIVNMERWRWMPRELGGFHVAVNVPEFVVRVVKEGETVHQTRVVVGKPDSPTPLFSQPMDHLVVNPYWNVPVSIVKNEMLSEIRGNPHGYFSKKGYQVLAQSGGKMRVVDPRTVNWWAAHPEPVRIRQIPGDANALGRIKFMFPNQHSVYLHDTPSKKLFGRDFRAYSHGCVRVDNPLDFADAILAVASPEWNSTRLEKLYGGPERWINLANPVPVHLAYFTAVVEPDQSIRWFDDIYGFDQTMRAALEL